MSVLLPPGVTPPAVPTVRITLTLDGAGNFNVDAPLDNKPLCLEILAKAMLAVLAYDARTVQLAGKVPAVDPIAYTGRGGR